MTFTDLKCQRTLTHNAVDLSSAKPTPEGEGVRVLKSTGADIELADAVAPNNDNVRFFVLRLRG